MSEELSVTRSVVNTTPPPADADQDEEDDATWNFEADPGSDGEIYILGADMGQLTSAMVEKEPALANFTANVKVYRDWTVVMVPDAGQLPPPGVAWHSAKGSTADEDEDNVRKELTCKLLVQLTALVLPMLPAWSSPPPPARGPGCKGVQ